MAAAARLLPVAAKRLTARARRLSTSTSTSPPATAVLYDQHGPPDKVLRVAVDSRLLSPGDWVIPSPPSLGTWQTYIGALPEPALGLNCVGGNAASVILKFLRQGGTMVTYGGMSKKPVTVSTSSFIFKDLSLRGFWLQKWMSSDKAEESRTMIDYLLDLVHEGKLKYEMELTPFSDFHLALDKALGKHGSQPKQVLKF
uniref:Uncharacterized protein n=1 Tax=Oryza nivara TaxID=4536 RepID=A0A0E0J5Q9_ORYNI